MQQAVSATTMAGGEMPKATKQVYNLGMFGDAELFILKGKIGCSLGYSKGVLTHSHVAVKLGFCNS